MAAAGRGLRIALIHANHAAVGGAEAWLNQTAVFLVEAGHQVTILCRRQGAALHPRVRFVRLKPLALGNAWREWAFAGAVERHVAAAPYDLVVGLGRTWSQDVLRCGGAMRETYLGLQRRFLYRPWERWLGKGALKGWVAMAIERRAFAPGRYRRIIANSELIKRDIVAVHGVDPADISVIHNGVDLERFHPGLGRQRAELRREWGIADDEFALLFLGQGFARKGLGPLLEALPAVVAHHPGVRLVVAGADRHEGRWRALARRQGLGSRVVFVGRRSDPEACFAAADLHVLPTWYDSFAYTVLESLATGVPVVTSANAGAAEIVDEGVHGSVVPADFSVGDLERALIEWCRPERAREAAIPARRRAEAHSQRSSMSQVAALLARVASERVAHSRGGVEGN